MPGLSLPPFIVACLWLAPKLKVISSLAQESDLP